MSRAVNLAMREDAIIKHCHDQNIHISVLEDLPGGGFRLVCDSVYGAEQVRLRLKRHVMDGDPQRAPFRPRNPLW
jgi:hypothetical protein